MSKVELENSNKFLESYLGSKEFFDRVDRLGLFKKSSAIKTRHRLETRARKTDSKTALSFGVHDPLWMLTRQWQFGEFNGDDCGSAIWAKIKIEHDEIGKLGNILQSENYSKDDVIEYHVEKMNEPITNAVRVDSAYYLKKLIEHSPLKEQTGKIIDHLIGKYPLEEFPDRTTDLKESSKSARECMLEIKKRHNPGMEPFLAAFARRSFDGHQLFVDLTARKTGEAVLSDFLSESEHAEFLKIRTSYIDWFTAAYQPNKKNRFWKEDKMSYDFSISATGEENIDYSGEGYDSGRLSWYSFDTEERDERAKAPVRTNEKEKEKFFTFIPTMAEFAGAPDKRLWAFEDRKVYMGNADLDTEDLANAMVLQYVTMYSNDWLLTPMELNAGMISKVTGIIVTDVFGTRYYVDRPVGDSTSKDARYSGKWEMFTVAGKNAYQKADFTTDGRLVYPPSAPRVMESNPVEEVQFLRDEMSNMVWGVETVINDGCGTSIDGNSFAADVMEELQTLNPKFENFEELEADYAYLFQNTVPLNWIPFTPVKIKAGKANAIREIRLQRSTMPLYVKEDFVTVRPNTSLLRTGINEDDMVTSHKFINEEEVIAVGTKVKLTNQRTRWFKGKTFNWLGAKKEISRSQANSGLSFDELVKIVKSSDSKFEL